MRGTMKLIRLLSSRLQLANFSGRTGKVHVFIPTSQEQTTFTFCSRPVHSSELFVRREVAEERLCEFCKHHLLTEHSNEIEVI